MFLLPYCAFVGKRKRGRIHIATRTKPPPILKREPKINEFRSHTMMMMMMMMSTTRAENPGVDETTPTSKNKPNQPLLDANQHFDFRTGRFAHCNSTQNEKPFQRPSCLFKGEKRRIISNESGLQ